MVTLHNYFLLKLIKRKNKNVPFIKLAINCNQFKIKIQELFFRFLSYGFVYYNLYHLLTKPYPHKYLNNQYIIYLLHIHFQKSQS